jgi:hypothetical protein
VPHPIKKKKKMFNKGDVSTDEAINGVVLSSKRSKVTVETEDGFNILSMS